MIDYKKIDFPFIENWCDTHGQSEWLDSKVLEDVIVDVYPYIEYTKKDGTKGRKYDKTQQPTKKTRPISFLQVKDEFITKFMPEVKPQAKAQPLTMRQKRAQRKK